MRMRPAAMGIDVVPTLKRSRKGTNSWSQPAERDAERHGGEDPRGEVAVEK